MSSHTVNLGLNQIRKIASRLYEDLDTPISLSCYLLMKYGEFDQIVEKKVDPSLYMTAYAFQLDYQAVSFLKKYPNLPTTYNRESVALEKFLQAEAQCKQTNFRLAQKQSINDAGRIVRLAQQKINGVLGPLPKVSDLRLRFGPGATSTCSGSNVNILAKLQSSIECSVDAFPFVREAFESNIELMSAHLQLDIEGPCSILQPLTFTNTNFNVLHFVPKDAKTDRGICIEPNSIIPLQLAHGSFMRKRLLFAGLDLNKQADVNRHFAYLGSIDGSYATIDLSSASDTISTELVRLLLPPEWYERLLSLTSEYTRLPDGTFHLNEKFSSMGNGFTFELETLIFYALSLATREFCNSSGSVMAFGDDIIVPSAIADQMIHVLTYCGFSINLDKTFLSGPFRESCGHDYYHGVNVRPYFFKLGDENVHPYQLYPVCNGIRSSASRFGGRDTKYCDSLLRRTWNVILRLIPHDFRHYGPLDFGDGVIHCSRLEKVEAVGCGSKSSEIRLVVTKPVAFSLNTKDYSCATKVAAIRYGSRPRISIRGRFSYKVNRLNVPAWSWHEYSWI